MPVAIAFITVLLLRGPQRLDGYLDPAHNIGRFASWDGRTLVPYDGTEPLTPEHWYRPGDGVRVRSEGYYFVGRLDDQGDTGQIRDQDVAFAGVMNRAGSRKQHQRGEADPRSDLHARMGQRHRSKFACETSQHV